MMTTENRSVHTLQKRNGEEIGWRVLYTTLKEEALLVGHQSTNKVLYTGPRRCCIMDQEKRMILFVIVLQAAG